MGRKEPQTNTKNRRTVKSRSSQTVDAHEKKRNFVTEAELDQLVDATRYTRYRWRNAAMLLVMFRHGLRVSELCGLRLRDVDLTSARVWIDRRKGSLSTEQPLEADELRAIKRYLKERSDSRLPWLFLTERSEQFTRFGFNYLLRTLGERAGLGFSVNPHMLRHGCGYALANRGYDTRLIQDYLGHRDPKHTAKYTRTASERFEGLWR